ncbi:MAG: DinB family protein [Pseudomonadota bacterium]
MKAHFERLAAYNAWANGRLYAAASARPAAELTTDLGAFFGSILATLNHIMVADLIWAARLRGVAQPPFGLDHVLHDTLAELTPARQAMDADLVRLVAEIDLAAPVHYRRGGTAYQAVPGDLLIHMFNHQTHHRGQVHAMLTRLGAPSPVLDLIYFQRGEG